VNARCEQADTVHRPIDLQRDLVKQLCGRWHMVTRLARSDQVGMAAHGGHACGYHTILKFLADVPRGHAHGVQCSAHVDSGGT
jgi:uncharacterized protein YjaZ